MRAAAPERVVVGSGTDRLSALIEIARERGFVGLALDGAELEAVIGAENDERLLASAIDVAQQRDEKIWAERLARRLSEIAQRPSFKLRAASILAGLGQCEEAKRLVAALPFDPGDELCRELHGVLAAKAGKVEQALAIFDALPGRVAGSHPAPIVLSTGYEMLEQCTAEQMRGIFAALAEQYPAHLLIRSFYLRYQLLLGEFANAGKLADVPEHIRNQAPLYDRRSFIEAVCDYFESAGWANQLFELVRETLIKDPEHWALYDRAARAALSAHRNKEFADLLTALPHPDMAEALAILCRWQVDENRLDEASKLLDRIRPLSADLFLKSRLYLSLFSRNQDQIDAAFDACVRCGTPPLGPIISYAIHTYYYNCSLERLRICLAKLEPFASPAQKNAHFWQTYLRCLIALGATSQAAACYFSLPSGLAYNAALKPFDMFFDSKEGRHEAAQNKWIKYIQSTRHPCVNAVSSYPRTIRLRYSESPDAVLLFVTLYNAIDYVDHFLDHYRRLGVNHFFVVDNNSNDGSLERLCEQEDVSVFQNGESFERSAFGVLWINHLLQRFGIGHWCFHVDSDEFFVFPQCHSGRSLRDLLAYCRQFGFGCVPAIEVDMFPEHLEIEPGIDPFTASCYFDGDYVVVEAELPPYIMAQGGVRGRLTGLPLSMHKSPLVQMNRNVRYFECNHSATHLPISDVTGALLHYKFVGDMQRRIAQAVARGEHFAGAVTYRRLSDAVAGRDGTKSLLSEHSIRYLGPDTLALHGLIKTSPQWTAFSMQHIREKPTSPAVID